MAPRKPVPPASAAVEKTSAPPVEAAAGEKKRRPFQKSWTEGSTGSKPKEDAKIAAEDEGCKDEVRGVGSAHSTPSKVEQLDGKGAEPAETARESPPKLKRNAEEQPAASVSEGRASKRAKAEPPTNPSVVDSKVNAASKKREVQGSAGGGKGKGGVKETATSKAGSQVAKGKRGAKVAKESKENTEVEVAQKAEPIPSPGFLSSFTPEMRERFERMKREREAELDLERMRKDVEQSKEEEEAEQKKITTQHSEFEKLLNKVPASSGTPKTKREKKEATAEWMEAYEEHGEKEGVDGMEVFNKSKDYLMSELRKQGVDTAKILRKEQVFQDDFTKLMVEKKLGFKALNESEKQKLNKAAKEYLGRRRRQG